MNCYFFSPTSLPKFYQTVWYSGVLAGNSVGFGFRIHIPPANYHSLLPSPSSCVFTCCSLRVACNPKLFWSLIHCRLPCSVQPASNTRPGFFFRFSLYLHTWAYAHAFRRCLSFILLMNGINFEFVAELFCLPFLFFYFFCFYGEKLTSRDQLKHSIVMKFHFIK